MKTLRSYLRALHKHNELSKEEYSANEGLTELPEHIA